MLDELKSDVVAQFKREHSPHILILTVDATPPAVRHGQQHVTKPAHEGKLSDGSNASANQSEKELRTQRRAAVQALKKSVLEAKLPHGLLLVRWHAESHGLRTEKLKRHARRNSSETAPVLKC